MSATIEIVSSVLGGIHPTLSGLEMARALEIVDQTVRQPDRVKAVRGGD
jgi:hypothetical protein